jgi:hypothetical protein
MSATTIILGGGDRILQTVRRAWFVFGEKYGPLPRTYL